MVPTAHATSAATTRGSAAHRGHRAPAGGRAGQALVETALALPLLMTLVAAAVDGGQLMAAASVATAAAAAGARAAAGDVARGASPSELQADAVSAVGLASGGLTCSGSGVPAHCVSVGAATSPHGAPVEVVTVYDTPSLLVAVGAPVTLTARGVASP